jgi:transposase
MTDKTPTTDPSAKPAEDLDRRTLRPPERVLILDLWQRSGLTARDFAALVGLSRQTLFAWKQRFARLGPAGLTDERRGGPTGSRLAEPTQRAILLLKHAHPEWGCERIRGVLLRGEG